MGIFVHMILHRVSIQRFFRWSAGAAAAMVLYFLFRDVDGPMLRSTLSVAGPAFLLVILLYGIGCLLDTAAWRLLFPSATLVPYRTLLIAHIAGEAMYRFLPAGVVIGESVKIVLMKKHSLVPIPELVSSLMLRKVLMGAAQAMYILLAVTAGVVLSAGEGGMFRTAGFITATILALLFVSLIVAVRRGTVCRSIFAILSSLPFPAVRRWLSEHRSAAVQADVLLYDAFRRSRRRSIAASLLFFGGWLTEMGETFVIILLISTGISAAQMMMAEPVISLLRSIAFILPAGVGVLDAGYVSAFREFGATEAVTAAAGFIILKRAKEVVWIIIGVTLTVVYGADLGSLMHQQRTEDMAIPEHP